MFEIGSRLREARERRGLELDAVVSETLIPRRYLDAFEHDQFELLPPSFYRRSFLRRYAQFLGLDAEAFVAELDLRASAQDEERGSEQMLTRRAGYLSIGRSASRPLLLLLALVLVGGGIWRLSATSGSGTPRSVTPPAASAASSASGRPARLPLARGPGPVLVLTAVRGPCWILVQVGSAARRTLMSGTLQQGESARFGLRRDLYIRFGAPWNLDARIGTHGITDELPAASGAEAVAAASGLRNAL